jgi:hypothetical protein
VGIEVCPVKVITDLKGFGTWQKGASAEDRSGRRTALYG